jgi:hypothetical protein
MKYKYFKTFLFIVFVLIADIIFAQGPPPPPPPVPIDGGLMGLIVLAIGYAIKKIKDLS